MTPHFGAGSARPFPSSPGPGPTPITFRHHNNLSFCHLEKAPRCEDAFCDSDKANICENADLCYRNETLRGCVKRESSENAERMRKTRAREEYANRLRR